MFGSRRFNMSLEIMIDDILVSDVYVFQSPSMDRHLHIRESAKAVSSAVLLRKHSVNTHLHHRI